MPVTHSVWCISANLIAIKNPQLKADFIQAYLSFGPGATQLQRAQSGQVQKKITTSDVANVLIPRVKNESGLVSTLEIARQQRRRQVQRAEELLGSLNAFVLDELGLQHPGSFTEKTTYAVNLLDVIAEKKLYPDYFHPERTRMIEAVERRYPGERSVRLKCVVDFRRDQRLVRPGDDYLGLANIQPNTGERIVRY